MTPHRRSLGSPLQLARTISPHPNATKQDAMTRSLALAALLAVSGTGVDAFTPSRLPGGAARTTSTSLDAKSNDTFESAARRVAGTGAAFFAGVSFAGQIAFADPNAVIASPVGKWHHPCTGILDVTFAVLYCVLCYFNSFARNLIATLQLT